MADAILISLHLPKTAGTSFGVALREHFGDDIRLHYETPPMQVGRWPRRWRALREGWRLRLRAEETLPRCVHGHFLPLRFRVGLRERPARYVTWLRDPVERLVSHYHYWRRDYDGADPAQPLRNRVLRENWNLERFCLAPELRNLYRQYLWGFDFDDFDFVGITEHYAEDLARFAQRYLGGQAALATALANPEREIDGYRIDPQLRRRIEAYHAADVALYRRALQRRRSMLDPAYGVSTPLSLPPLRPLPKQV